MILSALASAFFVLAVAVYGKLFYFEYILIGAFVANDEGLRAKISAYAGLANFSGLFVLAAPFLAHMDIFVRHAGLGSMLVLRVVSALALGHVVFAAVGRRGAAVGIVDRPLVQKIGLVSYSLYLWQQLILVAPASGSAGMGIGAWMMANPLSPALVIPVALASYYGLEKPMIRLGRRLSERRMGAGALQPTHS